MNSSNEDDGMTNEEFLQWIKDPENQKVLEEEMKNVAGGEYGAMSPEIMQSANAALAKLQAKQRVTIVQRKLQEMGAVLSGKEGSAAERLDRCVALVEETTDLLLDVPEPHRTKFMKIFLPIREQIRVLRG